MYRFSLGFGIGFLLVVGLLAGLNSGRKAEASVWQAKVDPWLLLQVNERAAELDFIVQLAPQADVSAAAALQGKAAKGRYVFEQLRATAARTQPPILADLQTVGVTARPLWITNAIWMRGSAAVVARMAQRADVAYVYANPPVVLDQPTRAEVRAATAVAWGVAQINADDFWNLGFQGEGIVIGGQDTGVEWSHPALRLHYRGWNGTTADHNYNWHDAIHANNEQTQAGNPCGFNLLAPCDDNGHGTHTVGTMVGSDGAEKQIGVAPEAEWIACRNMEEGWGTPATYLECFQWFLAPTDLANANPNPAKAPHVINNSWNCPPSEGCSQANFGLLETAVENLRQAGIVVVASAGNSGSLGCSTIESPPAIYPNVLAVGATDAADDITPFSSRGPVTYRGQSWLKPDLVAPGQSIYSAYRNGSYEYLSGTSMAGPHVVGAIALLLSTGHPALDGDVAAVEELLRETAVPRSTTEGCGGLTDAPNHVYGYGRVDVLAAWQALPQALVVAKTAPTSVSPGSLFTTTVTLTYLHAFSTTTGVVLTDVVPAYTELVTATMPYTLVTSGSEPLLRWEWPTLAAAERVTITVTLRTATVLPSNFSALDAGRYSAASDDIAAVAGPPVSIPILRYDVLLPGVVKP